ncbi:hypothetical protein K438DRAFT_1265198 [Mycena galopus ATCC 62051]|nr:hypothetical protein K438DRAFT_1265198 [Mycena galopus ATCC 62051]
MLYESIAFRNVCQVSALLRTLKNQTSFGQMIKEIGVHCCAPKEYSTVFETDLSAVIACAPRLSAVLLHSPSPWPWHLPIPITFTQIRSLTHLDCGMSMDYAAIHQHLGHLSSSLVSLSIHLSTTFVLSPPDVIHTFTHLEILRCSAIGAAPALPLLAKRLILPALKTFIFPFILKDAPSQLGACSAFCKMWGGNLRALSFWLAGSIPSQTYTGSMVYGPNMEPILESCPHLEHLILPGALASSPDLSHPKVKWLDFWTIHHDSNSSFLDSITVTNFPAVKGIRQFLVSGPLLFGHIPTTIPPHLNLEAPFEFDYPGFFLRHGNNLVYRNDAVDSLGAEYDESDEDDGDCVDEDYVPHSSSSSASSDSSESSYALSEESEPHEWEADHESTLALYDQLLYN